MKKGYSFDALAQLAEAVANEEEMGRMRFASQEESNSGAPDLALSPEKLLQGFDSEASDYGSLDLPECLGGFALRWGYTYANKADVEEDDWVYSDFKKPFKEFYGLIAIHSGSQAEQTNITYSRWLTDEKKTVFLTSYTGPSDISVFYLAIGK